MGRVGKGHVKFKMDRGGPTLTHFLEVHIMVFYSTLTHFSVLIFFFCYLSFHFLYRIELHGLDIFVFG